MTKLALREQQAAGQGPDGITTCFSFAFGFFLSVSISQRGLRRQMLNIKDSKRGKPYFLKLPRRTPYWL
jgi:hypothetical protein